MLFYIFFSSSMYFFMLLEKWELKYRNIIVGVLKVIKKFMKKLRLKCVFF